MKGSRRKLRGRGAQTVWELRVHAGRSAVTGKSKYVSRTVKGTAAEADEALGKLVAEYGHADPGGAGKTLGDLLDKWLAHASVLKELSPTTIREHRRTIERTIKPVLGDIDLRKLDAADLDAFYASLRTRTDPKPLAASTVRRVHAVIAAACAQGIKWRWLTDNPALFATQPQAQQAPMTPPTVEEVQRLIETAERDDPDMATFIALAAITGARRGELCGLQWGDVDEQLGTLTIERSYAVVGGQHIFKSTKTHGIRRIALGEFGLEVLHRQRDRLEERAAEVELEVTDETPVLTYDLVDPISPDTASHYVRALARTAGVDTHLHALRHFAASSMIGAGQDVRTVAGRLGHADASTTLKVYAHVLPQRDLEAAAALGKALKPE